MEIGRNSFASYSAPAAQPQPVAKAEPVAQEKAEEPKEKTLLEEIREKGFGTYLEELQEKKKEELRAKILGEMGLTEEDLTNMSPEQRAQIEKIVENELQKRMTAEAELNKDDKTKIGLHNVNVLQPNAKIDSAGIGLGPLLALQEIEQNSDQITPKEEKTAG